MNIWSLRAARFGAACALLASFGPPVLAHGARVGEIEISHPYATPSLAGTRNGAAYFVKLENTGAKADKLVRASTPAADRVELHSMAVDGQGVMRMREIAAIELAPKASIALRPGARFHLMMMSLKEPLKEGASFPMTLEFERAGKVEVKVVVQVPKPRDAAASHAH